MPKSWPMPTDMSMLLELQMRLRRAVLGGDTAEIVAAIQGDGLDPAARVGIYRHHAFATLGDALQGTFPVVCRLVDRRFFAYAAHEYLREHPPHSGCLVEYGADFADFLAGFAPCEKLPYLADVARFEWALNIAATVREATPLQAKSLAVIPPGEAAYVALRLQPSLSYFASPWPIDAIWQANKEDEVPPIDITSGGTSLEIRRAGEAVFWSSGLTKIASWDTTIALFRDEYMVPLLTPEIAAAWSAAFELSCSPLIVLGLATRLATLPLLGMTFVIQTFVYPEYWTQHLMWASVLLFLLTKSPGGFSLDHYVERLLRTNGL